MATEYMTVKGMMEYLQISRKTAYNLAASGKIPTYRLSPRKTLVKKSDIDKYLAKRKS